MEAVPSVAGLSQGVTAAGRPVTIRFNGRTIATMDGQSVLAALTAVGEKVCRETAGGAPRGMFCGMGVCQDCIVDVAGVGNQRACMTPVSEAMEIHTAAARPEPSASAGASTTVRLSPDLLVVGGGPAGLAAAAVAAEAGLDVVLIDERQKLGGQYYKQPAAGFSLDERKADRQFRAGLALIRRLAASGARRLEGTTVWAAFGPDEIVASSETSTVVIRPKRLVLATGAYERGVPLPGWTLPGFMTTGAMQTLLRSYQIAPGSRVLLAGNGPLNLQVSAELVRAGVVVVGLAEAAERPRLGSAGAIAAMAAASPDLMRAGLGMLATLRRAGVPTFHGHTVVRAEGQRSVERVVIARIDKDGRPRAGTERAFEVDAVGVGFGFLPSNEIARALGCRHTFDDRRGHLVATRDERGRSSVPTVWIVGDSAGLGGARAAEASGLVAGADVARDLGHPVRDSRPVEDAVRAMSRARSFQAALWRLYRAPRIIDELARPDTVVCRCEEVPLARIKEALEGDTATAGAVKRLTRVGMGRCQGRYCGDILVHMLARRHGLSADDLSFFAPRMPFKPVHIDTVADLDG